MKFLFLSITLFLLISCRDNSLKEIRGDNFLAIGHFEKDSIYNGEVKFYSINKNILYSVCNYTNGILNGERKEYQSNGTISSITNYKDGLLNGYFTTFDEHGKKLKKEYYYYDIKVGHEFTFSEDTLLKYSFSELTGKTLLELDYNNCCINLDKTDKFSINSQKIVSTNYGFKQNETEYLLYLPNPPKFEFKYSLSLLDTVKKIIVKDVRVFPTDSIWAKFSISDSSKYQNAKDGLTYVIKLNINYTISNKSTHYYFPLD